MEGETINIIENLIRAVSLLNSTEEYLDGLNDSLSECDSIISDYEHFIESFKVEEVDLKKLFSNMQAVFNKRRQIKNSIALRDNYRNLSNRLNNKTNREFFLQSMKTAQSKLGTKYHNRILKQEDIMNLKKEIKRGRGRPKKIKEEVTENVI